MSRGGGVLRSRRPKVKKKNNEEESKWSSTGNKHNLFRVSCIERTLACLKQLGPVLVIRQIN